MTQKQALVFALEAGKDLTVLNHARKAGTVYAAKKSVQRKFKVT